jgi:tetratricopeptide (TPR) repeat protein
MTPVDRAQSVFVGRSSEMACLRQAFEAVKSGQGPRLVVLQGESGVGKTRIIQEFFHALSTQYDAAEPTGFWPDRLGRRDESLAVDPEFPRCDNDALMPFLWTAIRFSDPGQKNSSPGEDLVTGWRNKLALLGLLLINSAKKKRGLLQIGWADIKKSVRDVANDPGRLAESAVSQILGATGIPLADKVVPVIRNLFVGILKSDGPGAEIQREIDARREARAEVELFRYVYDDLAATEIPTVMLVDDAQWANSDFALMLARLCDAAHHRRWPMLFVATCWPEPWHKAEAFVAKGGALPKDPSQYAEWINRPDAGLLAVLVSKRAELLEVKRLKPGADGNDPLALMLREAFPGMQDAHRRILLDAAEGNPQHLLILIREIADCETWFQDKNTNNPLKPEVTYGDEDERMSAEEALRRLGKIQIVDLVRRQLQKAEEGVKAGVAFGSHIGMSFPAELARRLAVAHGQAVDQQALMKAWRPHAFVETRGEAATHRIYEFAARVYRSAAQRILRNSFVSEEEEVDRTLGLVLKEWIENDDVWRGLPREIRTTAVEIAIDRERCAEEIDPFRLLDRVDDRLRILREQNAFLSIGDLLERTEPVVQRALDVAQRALARLCEEERTWPVASLHRLMNVLVMRGVLAAELSRPGLALASYDEAIGLRRDLLAALGEQAPPEMRNDLAARAGMNRGNLRSGLSAVSTRRWRPMTRRSASGAPCWRHSASRRRPGMRNDLAGALMNRGNALWSLGRLDEAVASYDEVIGLRRALLAALGEQAPPGMRNDLATALMNRGNALWSLGRLDEALASYDEAIGLWRALLAALGEQAPPEMRNDLAGALMNRGVALSSLGRLDEAVASYDEAIGLWRALLAALGEQAPPGMRNDLAKALMNRGNALSSLGRLDEAVAAYDEAIGLWRALLAALGEQAPPEMRNDLAGALMNRGLALSVSRPSRRGVWRPTTR